MLTFSRVRQNKDIQVLIEKADDVMIELGFTEHSYPHVLKVAEDAKYILKTLDYSQNDIELGQIAGYMHDIGNLINRHGHAQSGANLAYTLLDKMGADVDDIVTITSAIGNHDESTAYPICPITAALILADKCDVRASRVRNPDTRAFDIHDRVNYSVKKSKLEIDKEKEEIALKLKIDTNECSVMDYFEIFLNRMLLSRKAAEKLNLKFQLIVNEQELL